MGAPRGSKGVVPLAGFGVVEADLLPIPDRRRDGGQQPDLDLRIGHIGSGVLRTGADGAAQGLDLAPEPVRQDRLELGQGASTGLLDPGDPGRRRKPDGDGHRLLVVEQQRRQLGPDAEPVVPIPTAYGVHRVVEPAQPVDVVADRPGTHVEPRGELTAGPDRARLEQAEQCQQSG